MKRLFLCAGLLMCGGVVAAQGTGEGRRFYLDSERGRDEASGRTQEEAWRTIRRLGRETLAGGDTVLFRRGGLWREPLKPKSGEPGKPVVYDAYGDGRLPILQGSANRNRAGDWKACGERLWETVTAAPELRGKVAIDVAAAWRMYREAPADAKLENVRGNGVNRMRLTVKKQGEKGSHIQLLGPAVPAEGLADSAMLRVRMRSTKPFTLTSILVRKKDAPWTAFLHAAKAVAVNEEWQEHDIFLTHREGAEHGQLVFYVGDAVPDNAVFEFEVLSFHAAVMPEGREALTVDVGNLIVDHGQFIGFKRWRIDELKETGDFWYDAEHGRVVVYSEKNPAELGESIELCLKRNIIDHGGVHDCVIRNLALRYGAAHGIAGQGARRVLVEDCDISYIGGGHLYTRNGRPTRYGNGIEWWCEAEDCLVRRCRVWEVYDVAFSPQGDAPNRTIKNITILDCTIWNCEQSFEYWRTGDGAVTENVVFERNTCVDAGFGWSHRQRPDKRGTHFLSYNVTAKTGITLRDNIFCRGRNDLISMFSDWRDGARLHNNLWWQPDNEHLVFFKGKNVFKAEEFPRYLSEFGIEKDSVRAEPVFVNPARRNYRLAPDSPGQTLASDGGAVGRRDFR